MKLSGLVAVILALVISNASAQMPETTAPPGAKVYFVNLKNGDTVTRPVKVVMGLTGMGIAPAGIEFPDTGHHHLIIDAPTPPAGQVIAVDANHVHFGKGQTEATLDLALGRHTLQLVLGDRNHVPHKPAVVSGVITITVR
ncbi:MAG: DUF4399 domain-containing protein [Gammaproteobacteria bacterium]|nr:DUF4399 domain-containing protein [Gammaproteobacteria bacterium]